MPFRNKKIQLRLSIIIAAQIISAAPHSEELNPIDVSFNWTVVKSRWSIDDEQKFREFVGIIGEAVSQRQCWSVNSCLNGSLRHPYRSTNPPNFEYSADCADLPYYLRAYFAWKNRLPFSRANDVRARGGATSDIRYSPSGNYIYGRTEYTQSTDSVFIDARKVLQGINNTISTAHFRVLDRETDPEQSDFYPVDIKRDSIHPGTVIYDPAGHAAMIYKVASDGQLFYVDAHPDNSMTTGVYGTKFTQQSSPNTAPGLKYWRPQELMQARTGRDGVLLGGHIELARDNTIPNYSMVQYLGNKEPLPTIDQWRNRKYVIDSNEYTFHDFVRIKLAGANIRYNPLNETANIVDGLCNELQYRKAAVEASITSHIDRRSQPARFPTNIYGTEGDWETYSTPSRDARIKVTFKELRDTVEKFLKLWRAGDNRIEYNGTDLPGDILNIYLRHSRNCIISIKQTDGKIKNVDLDQISNKLFKLSFDPYHCVEHRWGGESGADLGACRDQAVKTRWYNAEQRLRNQLERRYDISMDFDITQLEAKVPGTGVDNPPDIDIRKLIRTY